MNAGGRLRTLLVTSRVTFVPHNYDDLVVPLAACPEVAGLLVLDNRRPALLRRAVGLVCTGAPRLGSLLLANRFGRSPSRRRAAYAAQDKPVRSLRSVNGRDAVRLVSDGEYDLIVNARTRSVYRREILAAPRLGCLNVHHGLLPDQRGLLCDLWALFEGAEAGFSVHVMAPEVDAGALLARVPVSDGTDRDYPAYLQRAARAEAPTLRGVLAAIERNGRVEGTPNTATAALQVRRNPTWPERRRMRRAWLRL